MTKSTFLIVLMFGSIATLGQDISVTFTGTGAATSIDSVTATNLRTNQSVTLPGNETLILTVNTRIISISEPANMGLVYPNPFSGKAIFTTIVQKPQTVTLKVMSLVGQVIAQSQVPIQSRESEFELFLNTAGIYAVCLTTDEGIMSFKVICTESTESENRIHYNGTLSNSNSNPSPSVHKSMQKGFLLEYSAGDVIHYELISGNYTTIITDSPATSKNFEVEFVSCLDPDGQNYSVVKIGDQTWMAENLAYLPAVSASSEGSETSGFLYIYGYEGRNVLEAKTNPDYSRYGALYNWSAAMIICPDGWHLPVDAEWQMLSEYLDLGAGNKIKSQSGWNGPIGNGDNSTGFNAFPAGYRGDNGFFSKGLGAYFHTASESSPTDVWNRNLYYLFDGGMNSNTINKAIGASVRCVRGASLPTVSTTYVSNITQESATGGGEVIENGGAEVTQRGICWNTNGNPRVSDQKTNDGNGTGEFVSALTELTIGTVYYVRAYATNSTGTAYGEERRFSTKGENGTFTDTRDGHEYHWINIGEQTWMAENLAYLPSVSPSYIGSTEEKVYYVYDFQGFDVDSAKSSPNFSIYGVLYNWSAAMDGASSSDNTPSGVQGVCPPGWHLPSDAEWTILRDYVGEFPGRKLKEEGNSHWSAPNDGTNEVGFTALPSGARMLDGLFDRLGGYAHYRTCTESGIDKVVEYYMRTNGYFFLPYSTYKDYADAVRCLKD